MSDVEMAPEATAPQEDEEEQEIQPEEYEVLNAKLDDLNAALDVIEQKNDRIYKEFFQLMQSNNEIREELQKEIQKTTGKEGNNSTEKQ